MAVSSSTDFDLSGANLTQEARSLLGVHADEEPVAAHETTRALRQLTMMLKTWQADGLMAHTLTEGSFALALADESVTFGSGADVTTVPFDMSDVRLTRSSVDYVLQEISAEEYQAIPNKANQGRPIMWYYDRQRATGKLYLWPAVDATLGTLKFTYRRTINDMDAAANTLDLPPEWHEAVVYNLAVRLAPHYGVVGSPDFQAVAAIAGQSYQAIKQFDVGEGRGSIRILPTAYRRSAAYR